MPWRGEHILELHRKIRKLRSKLCKEIFGHIMAVIVFSGLVIISVVEVLKYRDGDLRSRPLTQLLAALVAIFHFGLVATAILHLKYCGVTEINPLKCKIWIYLEVYNIAATTVFIVVASRHLLPAPFHQWTGTSFLLLVYWLPLVMYKTSQVCRMLELINILNYLQENNTMNSVGKSCYDAPGSSVRSINRHHQFRNSNGNTSATTTPPQITSSIREFSPVPKSASSPHIPYEWALIGSMGGTLP